MEILIAVAWYVVGLVVCLGYCILVDRTITKHDLRASLTMSFLGPVVIVALAWMAFSRWSEDEDVLVDFRKKEPPAKPPGRSVP